MNTPMQELEDQLRAHYQKEFGEPSPAADLWSKISGRLPIQEQPLCWWRRWPQAFAPTRRAIPSWPRLIPARRVLGVGSLLCALLCVAGLVYGGLWAFRAHPTAPAVSSASDALLAQLLLNNSKESIQQLAQSNQFTIHQTQTVNGDTVTLQKILADANNVVLAYTIEGHTPLSAFPVHIETITLAGGQTLLPSTTEVQAKPNTPSSNGYSLNPPAAFLTYFSPPAFEGPSQHVHLQITIPIGETSAHFAVTVPFYAAKIVPIHQMVAVNGQAFTLDRAALTPSEARFYFKNGSPDPTYLGWHLSIAGKTYDENAGSEPTGSEDYLSFWEALQNDTGTWTLKISPLEDASQTLAQFTFSVA